MESSKEGGLDSWKPNEEIPVLVRGDKLTGSEIAGYLHRGQGGGQQSTLSHMAAAADLTHLSIPSPQFTYLATSNGNSPYRV
jgi:hypothetical protein